MKKAILILSIIAFTSNAFAGENTSEEKNFVTESDWKGVKCKKHYEDDGSSVQECVFTNANLLQIYNIVKKIDPNLKKELPTKNLEYPSTKNGCISVDYQYKSKNHLYIELFYNGGVTYVEIIENKNNTQSKITYSPD